jgi:hypothetical protein
MPTFIIDGITYVSRSSTTVDVSLNANTTGSINIPASVTNDGTTYSVTSIGDSAFQNCFGLTSITIPNSVTSIDNYAFDGCSALISVTIPNSVISIGDHAFRACSGLTSITIPSSVTIISNYVFTGCSGLTSVTIPSSVTSIGEAAFFDCSGLTSITIPSSVTSIGDLAFTMCTGLTSIICNIGIPLPINPMVFQNLNLGACSLTVPTASLAAYQAANVWKNFNPIMTGTTYVLHISDDHDDADGNSFEWYINNQLFATYSAPSVTTHFLSTQDSVKLVYKKGNYAGECNVRITKDSIDVFNDQDGFQNLLTNAVLYQFPPAPPSAPTNVTATAGNGQVSVAFTPSASTGGAAVTYTATSTPGGFTKSGLTSPLLVEGLTNGTPYIFNVVASNIAGSSAASAASASVTPVLMWEQLGLDIDGQAAGDQSGTSVSLSADGTRIAIGAPKNDVGGSNSGQVRVYDLVSGVWTLVGQAINGERVNDYSGWSVSLSANGMRVAIGAYQNYGVNGIISNCGHTRIYDLIGTTWTLVGQAIDGEAAEDNSGYSVSLSPDGTCVAIGAPGNDDSGSSSGNVCVYKYINSSWVKLGSNINSGKVEYETSGKSISLSTDGTRVAIGTPLGDYATGRVCIYDYNGTSWTQVGGDINGYAAGDNSGRSVSLSADGMRVAIGAINNNENGSYSGQVRIYDLIGTTWTQVGQAINGQAAGDQSGLSVSLRANGMRVAIGANLNDGGGSNSGHVRVFDLVGSTWTQVGAAIKGEAAEDRSGRSVSLSADGTRVAIGAQDNGAGRGHVRVYEIYTPVTVPSVPTIGTATAGNGQVSVAFTPSADTGGAAVTYTVTSNTGNHTAAGLTSPLLVEGLTNGTSYTFTVVASNIAGSSDPSAASASVTPVGPPSVPTIGTAVLGSNSGEAIVSFTAPGSNGGATITNYTVIPSSGIAQSATASPYTFTGLTNGTSYTFTVVANNSAGFSSAASDSSNSVTPAPTSVVPDAPTNVIATAGNSQVTVAFTAPANDGNSSITGYTVTTYTGTPSVFVKDVLVNTPATSVAVTGLTNGTAYTFTVVATNGVGSSAASAASASVTPAPAPHNITVNMNIAVSPSGTIEIFGQPAPVVPADIIDANVDLSASTLYSLDNSLIEFWEPSSARGTRLAELATMEGRNWKKLTRSLANGIQDCLEGEIDVSGAQPFNLSKYSAIPEYKKVANFGELALRTYAHYTLGHIDATAAITNDVAFVTAMLSGHRYDAAELAYVLGDDFSGVAAGTKANADIARSLVKALADKKSNPTAVLEIAEQVLGQDASRAMDADNNMLLPDKRQGLKFIAGDVIYMTIKLQTPEVVIANGQQVSAATLAAKYTAEVDYTLKITLN